MTPPDRPTSADMVSMRDYVDTRMAALNFAIEKAESQLRERLSTMNEFREQLRDQASRLATKEMLDVHCSQSDRRAASVEERLSKIENKLSNAEGRSWMMYTALGVGLTVLNIALSIALRILFP